MAHITEHAIDRYIERIDSRASRQQAEAAMMSAARVIDIAAAFGARVVRISCGAKLVLRDDAVVTVMPRNHIVHLNPRAI